MSNRNIKSWVQVEYHPSAEEIARIFWEMDSEEQAYFLNYIGSQSNLAMQMNSIANDPVLDGNGKWAISVIGEYK